MPAPSCTAARGEQAPAHAMVVRVYSVTSVWLRRVDNSHVLSQESQAEKRALQEQLANTLDLQGVLEQHYAAKVRLRSTLISL